MTRQSPGLARPARSTEADGKEPVSVRPTPIRPARPLDLRRQIERLDGLPIRPASAQATQELSDLV